MIGAPSLVTMDASSDFIFVHTEAVRAVFG